MIVHDFDIVWAVNTPVETYPPLLVDPDAVLALANSFECLEAIAGKPAQRSQAVCSLQDAETLFSLSGEPLKFPDEFPVEQALCTGVSKAANHIRYVPRHPLYVKHTVWTTDAPLTPIVALAHVRYGEYTAEW